MSPGKLTGPIVTVTLVLSVVAPGVVRAQDTTTSGDTPWQEFGLFIGGVNQSLLEQEQLQNNLHLIPIHWTVSIVPEASDMGDRAYSPDSINIRLGDTVKWINDDTQFHTVTSGAGLSDSMKGNEFDSGLSAPNALTRNGKTFSHTFMQSGECASTIGNVLNFLAKPTGCDGIVDLNNAQNSPDLQRLVEYASNTIH